jgi:hypothetical protein
LMANRWRHFAFIYVWNYKKFFRLYRMPIFLIVIPVTAEDQYFRGGGRGEVLVIIHSFFALLWTRIYMHVSPTPNHRSSAANKSFI